jgi:hypothetical protein
MKYGQQALAMWLSDQYWKETLFPRNSAKQLSNSAAG